MSELVSDLAEMLRTMEPVLHEGVYVFASSPHAADVRPLEPVATIIEAEGTTVVVREEVAQRAGLRAEFRAAWITLSVHSDLNAVGLTAAFSKALADAGIGCNVIAGAHHDHIFVPSERREDAMSALRTLQRSRPVMRAAHRWLPAVALLGFVIPNGLFVYWLFFEFQTVGALLDNKLALAFILDCFMAMAILAVYFARRPIGPLRWPWFVGLSLLGGLAFSLPLYYWLNLRAIAKPDFQGS